MSAADDDVNDPEGVDFGISKTLDIQFSHVHLYVDHVKDVDEYKRYEDAVNKFHHEYDSLHNKTSMDVTRAKEIWSAMQEDISPAMENYSSHGRDVVKQLIAGFGFRVTGCYPSVGLKSTTKTVLVTSSDPKGIQVVLTSVDNENDGGHVVDDEYLHFDRGQFVILHSVFALK